MAGSQLRPTTILKEGWMKKKDEYLKTWKSRYLVLENDGALLEYEDDSVSEAKAQYSLKESEVCLLEDFDLNGVVISWQEPPSKLTLSANSEDERNEWLAALDSVTEDTLFPNVAVACDEQTDKIGLEDFELLRTLGKGAFGKVLLCKEIRTDEVYAIKVLKKTLIVRQMELDHIFTENEVLKSTNHPFLTHLKYSFQTTDFVCFVMEYVHGGDVFFHLNREGSFTEERMRFYAAETVLALEYLHSLDIVYRDLKTENLVLDKDGHIKLVDFGLCKQDVGYGQRTDTFCGTPEYMAPEILTQLEYGREVDWWGLGVIMYEMICAQLPFYNKNYDILITLITMKQVEFPVFVTPRAQNVIGDLLVKNPLRRLGSGPTDADEVKNHAFFRGLDWEAVEKRKIVPPFVPQLRDSTDTQYFDAEFTSEEVTLSKSNSGEGSTSKKDHFADFDFQNSFQSSRTEQ